MKELIGAVLMIVGLLGGGNYSLKKLHDSVKVAVLKKVSRGLPPLIRFQKVNVENP